MLDLVYENQTQSSQWREDFFTKVLELALAYLGLDQKQVEVGVQIVSPDRSQELNHQYRGKNKPTDVLSFPLEEKGLEKKYGILPLGDIVICLEVAERQAQEFGVPAKEEMARLVVHGLLHLLGYDHERSEADEEKMIDLQEKILKKLNLS